MSGDMMNKVLLLLLVILDWTNGQRSNKLDELLNWCIQGVHHKSVPGPEAELYHQCTPWKNRSCCSYNTTRDAHIANLYNFDFDHCGQLSPECKRHFQQDFCFFECSPNVGPWVVEVQMKTRKERFYKVPLCASDCDVWFNSCKDDLTCASNWLRNFDWKGGKNKCTAGAKCKKFRDVFRTSQDFCEQVWDSSWKVVPDDNACMRLWFDGSEGNPNDKVAYLRAQEIVQMNSANMFPISINLIFSVILLNIVIALQ